MKVSGVRHRRRWQVAVLAICLTLAQALWLLHRVAHFQVSSRAAVAHASEQLKSPPCDLATGSWAKALLPDHQDERSCADYDQLGHADMAPIRMAAAAPAATAASRQAPTNHHVTHLEARRYLDAAPANAPTIVSCRQIAKKPTPDNPPETARKSLRAAPERRDPASRLKLTPLIAATPAAAMSAVLTQKDGERDASGSSRSSAIFTGRTLPVGVA